MHCSPWEQPLFFTQSCAIFNNCVAASSDKHRLKPDNIYLYIEMEAQQWLQPHPPKNARRG